MVSRRRTCCNAELLCLAAWFPADLRRILGATLQEGVQEVGVLLLHGGDDPASPAGQRLTALMSSYSQVGMDPQNLGKKTPACEDSFKCACWLSGFVGVLAAQSWPPHADVQMPGQACLLVCACPSCCRMRR